MQPPGRLPDPGLKPVLALAVGVGGMAACITLVYLAMRAVMDIGGACADGGPYVSANPCPDGIPLAMILAIFGLFGFGGLALLGASGTGGYGWIPLLAWTGLFASLGWNFLDYGLFNPPEGQGIEWGYVIPGVLFQLMAWAPVAILVWGLRSQRRWRENRPVMVQDFTLTHPAEDAEPMRPPRVPESHRVEMAGGGRQAKLQAIDDAMGKLVIDASAAVPLGAPEPMSGPRPDRAMLIAHLEQLGEMREKRQLSAEEFEMAKAQVMQLLAEQP
jgi:hypothetical protein